jgi:hypothetical protein
MSGRRGFLGTALGAAVAPAGAELFHVHVWVQRLEGSDGNFTTKTVHLSDGPFTAAQASSRVRMIVAEGYGTGSFFYPPHRVLQIEIRTAPKRA